MRPPCGPGGRRRSPGPPDTALSAQQVALPCNMLGYVATCRATLRHVALCCNRTCPPRRPASVNARPTLVLADPARSSSGFSCHAEPRLAETPSGVDRFHSPPAAPTAAHIPYVLGSSTIDSSAALHVALNRGESGSMEACCCATTPPSPAVIRSWTEVPGTAAQRATMYPKACPRDQSR